jgi:hypothetical protein
MWLIFIICWDKGWESFSSLSSDHGAHFPDEFVVLEFVKASLCNAVRPLWHKLLSELHFDGGD